MILLSSPIYSLALRREWFRRPVKLAPFPPPCVMPFLLCRHCSSSPIVSCVYFAEHYPCPASRSRLDSSFQQRLAWSTIPYFLPFLRPALATTECTQTDRQTEKVPDWGELTVSFFITQLPFSPTIDVSMSRREINSTWDSSCATEMLKRPRIATTYLYSF